MLDGDGVEKVIGDAVGNRDGTIIGEQEDALASELVPSGQLLHVVA